MPGSSFLKPLHRRLRFKIGTLTLLVAIAAVAAFGYELKHRSDAAALDHARAADRLHLYEQMYKKRYVSKAQNLSEHSRFENAKRRLGY